MVPRIIPFFVCFTAITSFPSLGNAFATQTVYGFLDFTTTIGDTVMVFSPNSAPALSLELQENILENTIRTEPVISESQQKINPTKHSSYILASKIKHPTESQSGIYNTSSSLIEVLVSSSIETSISSKAAVSYIEKNMNNPEYDFLSRQPIEFVEESYRLISHRSSNNQASVANYGKRPHDNRKKKLSTAGHLISSPRSNLKNESIGQVITNISQSEKHIQAVPSFLHNNKSPIRPSSSLRILKTAAPSQKKIVLSLSGVSHRPTHSISRPQKNNSYKSNSNDVVDTETTTSFPEKNSSKKGRSRHKSKRRNKSSTTKINSFSTEVNNRRPLRSKIQTSPTETEISTSAFMLKLNRTPGRWQYKTSPKPRISIRKALSEITTPSEAELTNGIKDLSLENSHTSLENGDLESLGSQNGPVLNNISQGSMQIQLAETLNVEISTPDDFKSVYYEIATIKTPYIFQVGLLKKTRFITVTSTFEKTIAVEPTIVVNDNNPLVENILTSSLEDSQSITENSMSFLSPIHLDNKAETPSLETVIETFSTTFTKLKTQILPFIYDDLNETSYTTLIQTYDITTVIAATKTIFPLDDNHFVASRNFKDFSVVLDEAGSEINLELEFGDTDNAEVLNGGKQFIAISELPSNTENKKNFYNGSSSNIHMNEEKQKPSPINFFSPTQGLSTIVTTSQPYIVHETIWESHIVPIVNGISTSFRTLSKSIGSVDKTQYKVDTSTILLPQVPSPQISVNPYLLHQDYQTITSSVIRQTIVAQTNSKVLKLTFGAKTAYTTFYSTTDVPTVVTMIVTTTVHVQPSAVFPGYFAPPFHPFQFIG